MRPVFDFSQAKGARILSVLSSNNNAGERNIFLRIRSMESREAEDQRGRDKGKGHLQSSLLGQD